VDNLEQILNQFGKRVEKQAKTVLSKKKKRDTGKLYNSIKSGVEVSRKNSFSLFFEMEDYWDFIDQGVQGATTSINNRTSPFKFGTGSGPKGGLTKGIDSWVKRKRFQFRDRKTGKFLSFEQTAFLVRRSVWNKGIKETNFFRRPFELAFQKLPDEVVKAYNLDLDNLIKFSTKK
jgi:hypothetical protein